MQKRNIMKKNITAMKFVAGSCVKTLGISIKARLNPEFATYGKLFPESCICIPHIPKIKTLATIEMK